MRRSWLEADLLINDAPVREPVPSTRRGTDYIRWVQASLNRLIGTKLTVDGVAGARTKAAVRNFQRRAGLVQDGKVGSKTEAALIAQGAPRPPGAGSTHPSPPVSQGTGSSPAKGTPTLADLHRFSQRFMRQFTREIDCADLAIELWIYFGEQYRLPVAFAYGDSSGRRLVATRDGVRLKSTGALLKRFRSVPEFVHHVQVNVGARNLIDHTVPVAGGHRAAVAGDVFLWEYVSERTGKKSSIGHTQIFDQVFRSGGGPTMDRIQIYQGNLPASVPVQKVYPANFFSTRRTGVPIRPTRNSTEKEPHTAVPVGNGPRRFKGFAHLR